MRQISAPTPEALEAFLGSHRDAIEARERIEAQAERKREHARLISAAKLQPELAELREQAREAFEQWNTLGERIAAEYPARPVFRFAAEAYAIAQLISEAPAAQAETLAPIMAERFLACYYAAQHGAPRTEAERADFQRMRDALAQDAQRFRSMAREPENAGTANGPEMERFGRIAAAEGYGLEALAALPLPAAPVKVARIVRSIEVESHGVDHAQYFPGAGVCLTDFEDCATGVGNSEREALEDALESLAQSGDWEFQPENGYPPEPDREDYSEVDSVSEAEAEARNDCARVPDAIYRVCLYPFNGCGPISLEIDLPSRESALEFAAGYMERKRAAGFEVSEVEAFQRWEVILPGQGVGDSEGIVCLEVSNAREIERAEEALEAFDDTPSELSFYVTVRVSSEPESKGESYGLAEFISEDGSEYLYAKDSDAADAAAELAARESLWSWNLDFLSRYLPANVRGSDVLEALAKAQETLCESFGPILEALLGDKLPDALRAGISADGAGHFLATYDSETVRDSDGAYRFRIS